jgi:hypothetical protein
MREDGIQISSLETDCPSGMFFTVVWKRNGLQDYQKASSSETASEPEPSQECYLYRISESEVHSEMNMNVTSD